MADLSAPERPEGSLTSLLKTLLQDSSRLVREEVALAKAEVREAGRRLEQAVAWLAVGGVLGIAAALVLLTAINRGLTSLFAQFLPVGVAVWLAPLVLTLVFGGIAFALVQRGRAILRDVHFKPEQTLQTLEEDKEWIRSRAS